MVGENKICECRGEGAETKNEPVIERRAAQGTDKDIGKTVERRIESESASLSRGRRRAEYLCHRLRYLLALLIGSVGYPLAARESVPIEALNGLPFLLLEHGGKTEVSDLLERAHVQPDVRFTTWEDFAIMAMAERGLGVGILPDLILRRIPYRIEIRPLANPYYRPIGLAINPPLPPDTRSQEVYRIPAVPGSGRMTPRCRICSHTFFLFLLEIKHIFFRRTG